MLSNDQKRRVSQVIEQRITELTTDIGQEADESEELVRFANEQASSDPDAQAFADSTGEVDRTMLHKHKLERAALVHARQRLESEHFGVCSECGDAIPYKRLLAVPESTHCLRCAERSD